MKYEWRKQDKELYIPKNLPSLIEIPPLKYFTIKGKGNPNSDAFSKLVEALYKLSYTIRMMPKKGFTPDGYFEYTVFPLEGVWDLDEEGRKLNVLDKDRFVYILMIRQPDFVTDDLIMQAKESLINKGSEKLINEIELEVIQEGLCVQCMHVGSYDDEPKTFSLMEEFCKEKGLQRTEKIHKEIYISDPRKTATDKLKTVLRIKVTADF
ncbi:GyrI-like domain-containing protein [Peribacillus alkalitolerans]|uniref:GyrI-like domain-containing protein n=1 Tax=Peribacillus alkalitolerans TaxID=1550385 RepID=UPI0013D7A074|nr:GyrI-like domain-containing protein [Peribacillus alkalitolerans]